MIYLKDVVVFGYGKFGNSIANSVMREKNTNVMVAVNSDAEYEVAKMDRVNVAKFNLESDASLEELDILEETILLCALDNNHENLFLALTLRGLYKSNYIIAISDSSHLADKLRMAGVNRVIDIYNISANVIINILEQPVASRFLQGFINKSHDYVFKEIDILKGSPLCGKKLSEIDFNRYGIVFIGMINKDEGNQFVFATVGTDRVINEQDTIVCVGKEKDLIRFTTECGGVECSYQ